MRFAPLTWLVMVVACSEPLDQVTDAVRARDFSALMALRDNPDEALACKAVQAVVWARGPELAPHHQALLTFQRCPSKIRSEAAWALLEELDAEAAPGSLPALTAALTDADEKVRWNVARVIGLLGVPSGRDGLKACQSDPNKFVAAWCVWSSCVLADGPDCRRPNMNLTNGKPAP